MRRNDKYGVERVAKNLRFRVDLADKIQERADAAGVSWNAELQSLAGWALWFLGGHEGDKPLIGEIYIGRRGPGGDDAG